MLFLEVPKELSSSLNSLFASISNLVFTTTKYEEHQKFLLSAQRRDFQKLSHAIKPHFPEIHQQLEKLLTEYENEQKFCLNCRGKMLELWRYTHIMGVLNLTPDSFSDGGLYVDTDVAVEHALQMEDAGADIIDIGGESTRPGAEQTSLDEELGRVMPVIERLILQLHVPISIDTYKSEVARRALEAGVHMVNDISGLRFDSQMAQTAAEFNVPVAVMHIKGQPKNMQMNPTYTDLMGEIYDYLQESKELAIRANIPDSQIVIDPGIGFGKRLEDNYEILRRLGELRGLGCPILIGPSRKSFIGNVLNLPPDERLEGTSAAVACAISNGADIVRVHDVKEMQRVVKITDLIIGKEEFEKG